MKIFLPNILGFVSMENLCLWKNLFFWKTSLIKEKCDLVANFLDRGKIFASEKFPWLRKSFCLWKTSLIKKKSLLLENITDQGNIFGYGKNVSCGQLINQGKILICVKLFACGKFPWSMKNLCAKILWS